MATTRSVRQNVRNTKTGANAMNIQKAINNDFELLWRDYRKLGLELWRMPVAKFIVGGAAIGALIPVFLKLYKGDLDMDTIKEKFTEFVQMTKDEASTLNE
jgi:hypothetical protein